LKSDSDKLSVSAKLVKPEALTEQQKSTVGNNAIILDVSVSLKLYDGSGKETGSEALHELGGNLEISFPYNMLKGQADKTTAVYFLADDGTLEKMEFTYKDGK
jgi:hypothetical protein